MASTTASSRAGSPCVVQMRHNRPIAVACSSTPLATYAKEGPVTSSMTNATIPLPAPLSARACALAT